MKKQEKAGTKPEDKVVPNTVSKKVIENQDEDVCFTYSELEYLYADIDESSNRRMLYFSVGDLYTLIVAEYDFKEYQDRIFDWSASASQREEDSIFVCFPEYEQVGTCEHCGNPIMLIWDLMPGIDIIDLDEENKTN